MAGRQGHDGIERLRLRKAPMAAAALWFAAGIGLAHFVFQPVLVIVIALGLLTSLAILALTVAPRISWLPIAAIWIVAGMAAAEWQPGPPGTRAIVPYADGLSRRVIGRVTRVQLLPPRPSTPDSDQVAPWESAEELEPDSERAESIDLALDQIEEVTPDVATMVPIAAGLRTTVYGTEAEMPHLACGDRVEMNVRLKLPDRFRDPGVWQYADYLEEQGIGAHANIAAKAMKRAGSTPPSWPCRVVAARSWAVARLNGFLRSHANQALPAWLRLGSADAAMLDAMLFGDRTGLNRTMRTGFERTGSFHLFVVSGLHVTLLAGGVFWLLRRARLPIWATTFLTIAASTAYAVLTGFGQPVIRALTMTSIFLLARLVWRKGDPLNALGAATLTLLVWSPRSLLEASFQMTVLALIAIAGIAVPLGERSFVGYIPATRGIFAAGAGGNLISRSSRHRAQLRTMLQLWGEAFEAAFGRWTRTLPASVVRWALLALELALVGLVAELVMVLPMAVYFHRAAVFAVPANMVVIPVLGILAPMAVATFAASLVSPWVALAPGSATALLLHGITWIIGKISHLQSADVRVPGPLWWIGTLAVAAWLGCCWAVRRGQRGAWVTLAALPLIAAAVLWPPHPVTTPDRLELSTIDVGQGDSLLLVGPDARTMLVDAGGPVGQHGVSGVASNFDLGEEVVSPYLWSRRLRRLDVVVLTHAHTDHMGGMPAVLRNFRPRELWVGIDPESTLYRALLDEARELGVTVRHLHAGEGFAWGRTGVSVLSPAATYANPGAPKNDDSLVLRLDFGRGSVLLEGDAERASESAMLAAGAVTPVTVLKVGHHGSLTSTTPAFLAAAAPHDAVVSVGRGNTFGHPRNEVIGRIAASGAKLYRTDEFGLTTFLIDRDGAVQEVLGVR